MNSAMKWCTLCAAIATVLSGVWAIVWPLCYESLGHVTFGIIGRIVHILFALSLGSFFTILFIRQK